VTADVLGARSDWEDAYRRLEEAMRDPSRAEGLRRQLEVLLEELRKRVGATFTLRELTDEYRHADDWAREAVAERAATPGWVPALAMVEGAAFRLYSRSAVDYEP
jgi:hypothetical protein